MADEPKDRDPESPEFWKAKAKALAMYFRKKRARPWAVDDLVADVVARFFFAWKKGTRMDDPGKFIYGIAQRVLLEHLRANKRVDQSDDLQQLEATGLTPIEATSRAEEADDDPDRERRGAALHTCLATLEDHDREFITAFYAAGKNKEQRSALAKARGITANAMYIRASRLREKLLKCTSLNLAERK